VVPVGVRSAARGPVHGFGGRLLQALGEQVPGLLDMLRRAGPASSVRYEDRYVQSPCVAGQLRSVVCALAAEGVVASTTRLVVLTEPAGPHDRERTPRVVRDAWPELEPQQKVLEL